MIASSSEATSATINSNFINNLPIKEENFEENDRTNDMGEDQKTISNEQLQQFLVQFNIPQTTTRIEEENLDNKIEYPNLILNSEEQIKKEENKSQINLNEHKCSSSIKIETVNADCSSLKNLKHKVKHKKRHNEEGKLKSSIENSDTTQQQDFQISSFASLFNFLTQQKQPTTETNCSDTETSATTKTSFPSNLKTSQQQQFSQQLSELFTSGLQQLISLGASASSAGNIPNPIASISIEELGKMVLEQMCKEVGDQAYNILDGLTQQFVSQGKDQQPLLQQELTQNIISSLNNNFIGEDEQQKQFWQILQQYFINFNNNINNNDSGIFMEEEEKEVKEEIMEEEGLIKDNNNELINGQGMDCNISLQQQLNSLIPFFEQFFNQNQQTLPSNFLDCLQRIITNNNNTSIGENNCFSQLVEMFAAFQCWQLLQQQQNISTFSPQTFPNTALTSESNIDNFPTTAQTSTTKISETQQKRNNTKERSKNKKQQQNQNENKTSFLPLKQPFSLPQQSSEQTQNLITYDDNIPLVFNGNQTSVFTEQQQLIATQILSQLFGQQQNNDYQNINQNLLSTLNKNSNEFQNIQTNIQQNEYQNLHQNNITNIQSNNEQQTNQLSTTLASLISQGFLPLFNGMDPQQQQEILKQMFDQQQNINNNNCWKENKEENNEFQIIKEENKEEFNNENKQSLQQHKRLKKLSKASSNIQKTSPPSSSYLNIPSTGSLTVKSEKSLGALLRQNHDGVERIEELQEVEEFSKCFKKQRIKHGFTQGDVGVALGKRYGTDFSQTTISRFEALNLSYKNMCKLRPLLEDWLHETDRLITAGATVQDIMEGVAIQRVEMLSSKSTSSILTTNNASCVDRLNLTSEQPSSNISSFSPLKEGENNQINKNEEKIAPPISNFVYNSESIQSKILLPPFKKRRKRTNLDTTQKFSLDTFFRIDPRPDNARMVEIASLLDLDHDVVRVWFCNRRQKLRKN